MKALEYKSRIYLCFFNRNAILILSANTILVAAIVCGEAVQHNFSR